MNRQALTLIATHPASITQLVVVQRVTTGLQSPCMHAEQLRPPLNTCQIGMEVRSVDTLRSFRYAQGLDLPGQKAETLQPAGPVH